MDARPGGVKQAAEFPGSGRSPASGQATLPLRPGALHLVLAQLFRIDFLEPLLQPVRVAGVLDLDLAALLEDVILDVDPGSEPEGERERVGRAAVDLDRLPLP